MRFKNRNTINLFFQVEIKGIGDVMTNWDREKIIENAIREYKNSESKKVLKMH